MIVLSQDHPRAPLQSGVGGGEPLPLERVVPALAAAHESVSPRSSHFGLSLGFPAEDPLLYHRSFRSQPDGRRKRRAGRSDHTLSRNHPRVSWQSGGWGASMSGLYRDAPALIAAHESVPVARHLSQLSNTNVVELGIGWE
jgi:hypothetical protein